MSHTHVHMRRFSQIRRSWKRPAGLLPPSELFNKMPSKIGLRVALGVSGHNIPAMTVGQGMRPALLGIALGGIGASWLSRYLRALLFGVRPFDMATYFAVAALLLAMALLACYLLGRRAMCTDPAVALRIE
jgi:tetrahydromethanopterin S-methyltransferase subunit D